MLKQDEAWSSNFTVQLTTEETTWKHYSTEYYGRTAIKGTVNIIFHLNSELINSLYVSEGWYKQQLLDKRMLPSHITS